MILKYDVEVIKDEEGLNFVFLIDYDNEVVERLVEKMFHTAQAIKINNIESLESYPVLNGEYYEFDPYFRYVPKLMIYDIDKTNIVRGCKYNLIFKLADESYYYNLESEEAWVLLRDLSTVKNLIKSCDGKIDNPIFVSIVSVIHI